MGKIKFNKKLLKSIGKKFVFLVVVVLIACLLIFVTRKLSSYVYSKNLTNINWIKNHTNIVKDASLGDNIYSVSSNKDIDIYNLKYQKVINNKLNNLLDKNYSFNDMLIIYNLYGTNNLSYNIYFSSDIDSSLEYTISVENGDIAEFTRVLNNGNNDNLTKDHSYQLIGFVPGYKNKLTLNLKDSTGKIIDSRTITIDMSSIKCASATVLDNTTGESTSELSNGLYTILGNDSDSQDYVFMYDNSGVIRSEIPIIGYRAHAILFREDKMYFSISQSKIVEMNNLGEATDIFKTGKYYLHHDYTFDEDGNLLVLANNTLKDTEEDCIIKINLDTHEVSEVVDFEEIFKSYVETCKLDTTSQRDEGEDGLDWLHLNSIEYVNGDVILSSRETSSIIKVNDIESNPEIEYILADEKLWSDTEFSSYVYEKIGDFKIHAGQHSVRYSAGDEEGVYYLTFFDNNYGAAKSQPTFDYSSIGITNNNAFNGDNSYYYVYKVDENNKTFELVDDFSVLYSGIVSSVQTMDNDNIVVDSGTKGIFGEYDSAHNLIKQFTVKLNKYMVYRVLKYEFNDFWFKG